MPARRSVIMHIRMHVHFYSHTYACTFLCTHEHIYMFLILVPSFLFAKNIFVLLFCLVLYTYTQDAKKRRHRSSVATKSELRKLKEKSKQMVLNQISQEITSRSLLLEPLLQSLSLSMSKSILSYRSVFSAHFYQSLFKCTREWQIGLKLHTYYSHKQVQNPMRCQKIAKHPSSIWCKNSTQCSILPWRLAFGLKIFHRYRQYFRHKRVRTCMLAF